MFLLWGQANELNGSQRSTDCPTRMQRLKLQKREWFPQWLSTVYGSNDRLEGTSKEET